MKDGMYGQEKIQREIRYNSKDESGAYLNPADYPDIVLGTMKTTDDAQGMIEGLLGEMGFGEGIGNWSPAIPGGSAEYPGTGDPTTPGQNPGTDDPTNPGQNPGAGTDDENNSGNTGNNGAVNDTTNVVPYVVALLASVVILLGAVVIIRKRRK